MEYTLKVLACELIAGEIYKEIHKTYKLYNELQKLHEEWRTGAAADFGRRVMDFCDKLDPMYAAQYPAADMQIEACQKLLQKRMQEFCSSLASILEFCQKDEEGRGSH